MSAAARARVEHIRTLLAAVGVTHREQAAVVLQMAVACMIPTTDGPVLERVLESFPAAVPAPGYDPDSERPVKPFDPGEFPPRGTVRDNLDPGEQP